LATRTELSMGKSLETKEQCASFLYGFWKKREKAEEPVAYLWDSHVKKVAFVTQNYKSNLRPGYKTDRGRVFLMYGIPSNLERFPAETGALPYEIWRYDRLGAQNNVIFIFYDPDLATNEYPLLHSSKYGEVNNPRWRSIILKQNSTHIDYEGQNSDWDTKLNPND
ncbi:MAG: GWxTD domain-containing protein, partial [Bacteroidia bacterium]